MPSASRKAVAVVLSVLTVLFAVIAVQGLQGVTVRAATLAPSGPTSTPTSVTLVLDPQGPLSTRTPVTLVAELTPSSARGEVRFYDGGQLLDTGGPFRIDGVWTGASWTVGVHDLTAEFDPDENTGAPSSSQVAVLTIPAAAPATLAATATPTPSASDSSNIAVTVPPSSVVATESRSSAPASSSTSAPTAVTSSAVLGAGSVNQGTGALPHTGIDVIALVLGAAAALLCGGLLRAAGAGRGRHGR